MRYLVVGNVAVLASRGIERLDDATNGKIPVSVVGVPDGANLIVIGESQKSYTVTSELTEIPVEDIQKEGRYAVTLRWKQTDPQTKAETERAATGNSFSIVRDPYGLAIIPAPCSTSTELEHMWKGISQAIEILLPLFDEIRNGNDVI